MLDVALEVGVLVDSVVVITTMLELVGEEVELVADEVGLEGDEVELVVRLVLVKLDGKLGGLFV